VGLAATSGPRALGLAVTSDLIALDMGLAAKPFYKSEIIK